VTSSANATGSVRSVSPRVESDSTHLAQLDRGSAQHQAFPVGVLEASSELFRRHAHEDAGYWMDARLAPRDATLRNQQVSGSSPLVGSSPNPSPTRRRACEAECDRIREALGAVALRMRIGHHGSTSVAGLAARPGIDVQMSVAALQPMEVCAEGLRALG